MDVLINEETVGKLGQMLSLLPPGAPVAIDTETTGLHMHQDDVIRGVSLAFKLERQQPYSFYVPVGYPDNPLSEKQIVWLFGRLLERQPLLVLHHGKFDFAFLRQLPRADHGGPLFAFPEPHRWWDTKVVAWLLDENVANGLKPQAVFHFGAGEDDEQKEIKKLVRQKGWGGLTAEDIAPYAAKDAELTLRLYDRQRELLGGHPSVLGDVRPDIERELAIQAVLFRMEQTGILVNQRLLGELREKATATAETIEGWFTVNLNSPKQVAALLYDEWKLEPPNGSRSVNRAALEQLASHNAPTTPAGLVLDRLLEYRRVKKALTGYLVPLGERIGRDERVHPSFSSTGTVTGRFSCSDPNLQTIPRADTLVGVRDVFVAEVGYELWEYDLAAAELRVMAGMAGEERLIEQLENGVDMHSENAKALFGEHFTPLQRRSAKNIMYGWSYGLTNVNTAVKYVAGSGISQAEAKKIAAKVLAGLKKLYPKIYRLMLTTSRQASKDGYLPVGPNWPGRFRRFQTPGRPAPAYTALNAKVQGGIGEFMKDVMLLAEAQLDGIGARLCLQVHDSLVIEVPEGMGTKVQEILQAAADDVNPFEMRMLFDGKPWKDHD